jgi:tRNA threonylcarbamoyladenosine biosynthesis protein TsaE
MSTSPDTAVSVITLSPARTKALGRLMGRMLRAGDVIAISGELGTGKTVLIKGIAAGLGIDERNVTSPTFILMNEYKGRLPVYHFDAYRMIRAAEIEELGADDYFFGGGVSLIEWADHVAGSLPADRLEVLATHVNESRRLYDMRATGSRSAAIIAGLRKALIKKKSKK